MTGLFQRTYDCLMADSVETKLCAVDALWHDYIAGRLENDASRVPVLAIAEPGRPAQPVLVPPQELGRRNLGQAEGRAVMVHAIAHIEFTAINLALDAAYRFRGLPDDYYRGWLKVAWEEVQHFILLRQQLRHLGFDYGSFNAHGGLWELASRSADDLLTRMALLPRLMEARGLDVTPAMTEKFRKMGEAGIVAALERILRDEVGHVALGDYWFRQLCAERDLEPQATFRALLAAHGLPPPRGPFNRDARLRAGFTAEEIDSFSV